MAHSVATCTNRISNSNKPNFSPRISRLALGPTQEKDHYEDVGIDRNIILKWVLNK